MTALVLILILVSFAAAMFSVIQYAAIDISRNTIFILLQSIFRQNLITISVTLFLCIAITMIFALTVKKQIDSTINAILQAERQKKPVENDSCKASVMFCEIRGFVKIKGANRIVAWLNEYFTYMVHLVRKSEGIIGNFLGDTVMAYWKDLSAKPDAYNCVKTALMLRRTLIMLNSKRPQNDTTNPMVNIACGISYGTLTTGQLGPEPQEKALIGNSISLADTLKSLNKQFKTDILVTESVWKFTKDSFIYHEMPLVNIKGVTQKLRIFAVINLKNASGPQTLEELRSLLGIFNSK
jgi:adenylate cyclase